MKRQLVYKRMLVVLPICHKDAHLALSNLRRIHALDGTVPFTALISHDNSCDVTEHVCLARQVFASVQTCIYDVWPGDDIWPAPQNHAWQSTARFIEGSKLVETHTHWLWWEADARPLKRSWLTTLDEAWRTGGRPFLGHFVKSTDAHPPGWMNGVAIYPIRVSHYATNCFLTRLMPFDVSLSMETRLVPGSTLLTLGNTLIGHIRKESGGEASTTSLIDVLSLEKSIVLLHGAPRELYEDDKAPVELSEENVTAQRLPLLQALERIARTLVTGQSVSLSGADAPPIPATWQLRLTLPRPRVYHVCERHRQAADADDALRRVAFARDSWMWHYCAGTLIPAHTWQYSRDARALGDHRDLPYLKDILAAPLDCAGDHDVIFLTNDDTVLHHEAVAATVKALETAPCITSFRLNYDRGDLTTLDVNVNALAQTLSHDFGRDLFAFRSDWLREHWNEIPDFLLGEFEWDLVLAVIVRLASGVRTTRENIDTRFSECEIPFGYVLHERHERTWMRRDLKDAPGKQHNRALVSQFYSRCGINNLGGILDVK